MSARSDEHLPARPVAWARLLLLIPFVGLLWVPFYNFTEPSLFGFPFFYWYQLAWVLATAALLGGVVAATHEDADGGG